MPGGRIRLWLDARPMRHTAQQRWSNWRRDDTLNRAYSSRPTVQGDGTISVRAALHADDTTVPVLAPGLGKAKTGRLWVVVRDERPWGSGVPPAALYGYLADRKAIHAEALLGACRGFLHADGYAGFDRLYRPRIPAGEAPLVEVACWSHVRRKFFDVHQQTASPIALETLQRIAALFAIEGHIKGHAPERRLAARRIGG